MKKNYIQLILAVLILFSFSSCENDFNVDMEKKHVVLHSLAFEGESPKIILAKTLEVFPRYPFNLQYYDQPFYEENIEIIVSSGNETYTNFELHQFPLSISEYDNNKLSKEIQYYSNDAFIPKAGKEYTIEVYELETYPVVKRLGFSLKSTTTIPDKIPLKLEQLPDVIDPFYSEYEDTVWNKVYSISFDDQATVENYYYLNISTVISHIDFLMDTISMNQLWNDNYSNDIYLDNLKLSDNLRNLKGLPKINYADWGSELKGFLISDSDFDGQNKKIEIQLNTYEDSKYFVVELFHISKEYYNYYKTLQTQGSTQDDIFAEPTQIYTNIEGGLGVFAGASLSTQYIKIEPPTKIIP